jgi:uracil-DNA glycosylase
MDYAAELRGIITQTRKILDAERDSGIELPPLKTHAVEIKYDNAPVDTAPVPATLTDLKTELGICTRCKLCNGRKNIVFGEGSEKARLMFIGEGPGRDEDIEGRPFVGEAGQLLTKIIESGIGIKREEVYIANVVKCRPPENRDPEKDEINSCIAFLKKQIEIVKPEVICTLGRIAARELLNQGVQDHHGKRTMADIHEHTSHANLSSSLYPEKPWE